MTALPPRLRVRLALVVALGLVPGLAFVQGRPKSPPKPPAANPPPTRTPQAWTVKEALGQLALYPEDPYLQYVALQLAHRGKRLRAADDKVGPAVAEAIGRRERRGPAVDLFSIFTGALAVQESLQLDAMLGPPPAAPGGPKPLVGPVREKRDKEIVDIDKLAGPTVKSHPWVKMLGGKKPAISRLARQVPADFYFVHFRSLTKLLGLIDAGDLWGRHFLEQGPRQARTQRIAARLRQQLAIETDPLLRPVYDAVVAEVAITGSDLFLAEGSDVTFLIRAKAPVVLKKRMDDFLANAARGRKDVQRTEGTYLGVPYVHLTTPGRDVHVFSAWPEAGLLVRSNSRAGFERVLEAIKGKTPRGKAVRCLGDTEEFAYIRTLLPEGVPEEDGFIYLSDPFIRRMVGPQLKLTERRRMLCYNHLRMIGHAALMYRTEFGRAPKNLAGLAKAGCCPGTFNKGRLTCAGGGTYTLAADGQNGVCSHHGHAAALVPCCETPLAWVTGTEADAYERFRKAYSKYWSTFFDPIAIRIQVTPARYRLETLVLPLIDNSIYKGLTMAFGGKPEPLDALPVPPRNIFSVAARYNKEALVKEMGKEFDFLWIEVEKELVGLGVPAKDVEALDVMGLLKKGLGNQVSLHVYDAPTLFDFDAANALGLMLGGASGADDWTEELVMAFVASSINAPVYAAVPVRDAKIVDGFLDRLDKVLAVLSRTRENVGPRLRLEQDFYKARLKPDVWMRAYGFRFGPIKWRFFWARIGGALYVASKPFILQDLAALPAARAKGRAKPEREATGHLMVRLRPQHWKQVLTDDRLNWAENNRQACLQNLGPLSSVGRAVRAEVGTRPGDDLAGPVLRRAVRLYGTQFFCPDGGRYCVSADGKSCTCSIHGSARDPRQGLAPEGGGPNKVAASFKNVSATLTFLEDGLHAVFVVDRK